MLLSGKVLLLSVTIIGVGLNLLFKSSVAEGKKHGVACRYCSHWKEDVKLPLLVNPCSDVKIGGCKDSHNSSCNESISVAQPINTSPYKITALYTYGANTITVDINKPETPNELYYDHFLEARVVGKNKSILASRIGNFHLAGPHITRVGYIACDKGSICCKNPNAVDVALYADSYKTTKYNWFYDPSTTKDISIQFFATFIQQIRGSDIKYWTNLTTGIIPYYSCLTNRNRLTCGFFVRSQQTKRY